MKTTLQALRGTTALLALVAALSSGLARGNHYILPCPDDCRDVPRIKIGAGITGTWYAPAQSGQGFVIEVLPGQPLQMLATWFVFGPQGGQSWIVARGTASGSRADLQAYRMTGPGGRFPPNFDPADVHAEPWGTLSFTFTDCDNGRVEWTSTAPGYGSGSLDLERLTLPAGLICQSGGAGGASENGGMP